VTAPRPAAALALAALAALSVLAPVGAASGAGPAATADAAPEPETARASVDGPGDAGPAQTGNTIVVDQEYRLTPDRPGRVDLRWRFEPPDGVSELRTRPPEGATDVRADGFVRRDGEYVWERDRADTATPSLTFTRAVNVTTDRAGPIGTDGRLLFVDAGEWALIRRQPSAGFGYSYREDSGEPGVEYTNRTAGPGVVGEAIVFLGPHRSTTRTAHDQRFRLVVPDAATLAPGREAVFDTVTRASDTLRVGDRDERVLMVAAPTGVNWGVRGLQTGDSDLYTLADEPVDDPDSVWLHEYVHTRQEFETDESARWLTEATAEYYAGLLALRQDRVGFDAFRADLRRGTASRYDGVVLAEPGTWEGTGGNYERGGLVAGELDRRVRLASDGERSFGRVFRRLNRHQGAVGGADLLGYVERAGDGEVRRAARRFTETTEHPAVWDADAHEAAFGTAVARFDYRVDRDRLAVEGPFRNGSVRQAALLPGETLLLPVNVSNVGAGEGSYELVVTREGERVATRTGRLAGEANATETVPVGFPGTGTYRLSTGADRLVVTVSDPAPVRVREVTANRTRFGGGGVALTATVANDAPGPATGRVGIARDGTALLERRVTLGPGETATLDATTRLTDPGSYEFVAGNRSVSVTVERTPTRTTTAGRGGSTPGPGALGAGVAALLLGLVLACRRR